MVAWSSSVNENRAIVSTFIQVLEHQSSVSQNDPFSSKQQGELLHSPPPSPVGFIWKTEGWMRYVSSDIQKVTGFAANKVKNALLA